MLYMKTPTPAARRRTTKKRSRATPACLLNTPMQNDRVWENTKATSLENLRGGLASDTAATEAHQPLRSWKYCMLHLCALEGLVEIYLHILCSFSDHCGKCGYKLWCCRLTSDCSPACRHRCMAEELS